MPYKPEGLDYDAPDTVLTKSDYEWALHAQAACNVAGLVNTFSQVMKRIVEESRNKGGTNWWNSHPIVYMYVTQLAHLTGAGLVDQDRYSWAYEYCKQRSKFVPTPRKTECSGLVNCNCIHCDAS